MTLSINTDLIQYYAKRANDYDTLYTRAERQTDLQHIGALLRTTLTNKKVLEVACGTAYWTQFYADVAEITLATDINAAMLNVAQAKFAAHNATHPNAPIQFKNADAFNVPQGDFDAVFAGFWWSHVKRSEQSAFLQGLQKVAKGATLVLIDNCYVEGESTPIARTDAEGNTYQIRRLPDMSRHEVIKNFPTDSALRKKFADHARDIRITRTPYFWMLTAVLR